MTRNLIKTILLLDNDPVSSRHSGDIFKKNGYKVIKVGSIEEALKKADKGKVDLAVIDIESCNRFDDITTVLKNKKLPVIFQYSLSCPDVVKRTENIDSFGYLAKNSVESVLLACIKTALRLAESQKITDTGKSAEVELKEKNEKIKNLRIELDTANNIFRIVNEELCKNNVKLQEREEFYRTLFENTDAGIIVIEEDTTISLANKVFAESFGFSREDIQNKKKWTEMVIEEDRAFMLQQHHLRRVDPAKAKTRYEFRFIHRNGELRYHLIHLSLIPGTKKSIASIIDITESKKNEAALEAAEEKYRDLFMNSQIGIFRTDLLTGRVIEVNDCFARLFGFKNREDMLSQSVPVADFYISQSVREKMISYMRENGEIRNYEVQFKRRDGVILWVRYSARLVDDKGWIEGVSEDITALKFSETERNIIYNELLSSEKKYRLIFENSTLGLLHFNNKGIITHCNSSFESITEAAWQDLIGLNLLKLPDKNFVKAENTALNGRSGKYEGLYHL
jgi:PAS domain S-box-containing protein